MYSSIFVTAFLAASVSALYTPRSRHLHARHAINARVAMPEPLPAPVADPLAEASATQKVKRSSKKCKPRTPSATLASATTPSAAAAPVNVAPDTPKVVSAKQPAAAPTHKPAPSPSSKAPSNERKTSSAAAPKNTPHGGTSAGSNSANLPFGGDFHADGISGGDGTFYATGLGACGWTNNDNQDIAAIPFGLWDSIPGYSGGNPNNNPVCGKFIDVSYQGKTVTVEIVDECMGCDNIGSVDMSPHAFNQLADPSVGRISGISWKWH